MAGHKLRNSDFGTRITAKMETDSSKYPRFLPKEQNEVEPNTNAQANNVTAV